MIKELLNKRSAGETLTPEELSILVEYDGLIAVHESNIKKIATEKTSFEEKINNMELDLQDKIKLISSYDNKFKTLVDENESIKKILENTKSTSEARDLIEKERIEKAKKEAIERAKKEKEEILKAKEEEYKNKELEMEDLRNKYETIQFEKQCFLEIKNRPYAEKNINKIISEINEKGLVQSKMTLDIMLSMYDHDVEMKKLDDKNKANTNIFSKTETKITDKTDTKNTNTKYNGIDMEFAKRNRFI